MSLRLIVAASAGVLACLMVLTVVGISDKKAVAKLNKFLMDSTAPDETDFKVNLDIVETKDNSRYGMFENGLKIAIKAFLTATKAEGCTLEFVDAVGFLLANDKSQTRVNRLLRDGIWTEERREQCRNSLDRLAHGLDSQLPTNDEAMQTLLSYLKYIPQKHGIYCITDSDCDYVSPISRGFPSVYLHNPSVIHEILAIAESKSIALVENKYDEATGQLVSKQHRDRYKKLITNYFSKPCELYVHLTLNFVRVVRFLLGVPMSYVGVEEAFNALPGEVRNMYYRTRVCRLYRKFSEQYPKFFSKKSRETILKLYSDRHPARKL